MNATPQNPVHAPGAQLVYTELCGIVIPHPAVLRGWLHGRSFTGPWDVGQLTAAIGSGESWLSFHAPDDDALNEEAGASSRPVALAGTWLDGGFIELTLCRNTDLEDHPRYLLRVFADTPDRALALLDALKGRYLLEATVTAGGPRIGLLNASYSSLEVQRVHVGGDQLVQRDHAGLYYGDDAPAWLDAWIEKLGTRRYGLSILSGDPGTGKTTLLRSLAAWLAGSHLFYFMPASRFGLVDAGELVTFWAGENRLSRLRKVLVLEDAESILLRRDGDNRERVATLLNLTDGLMGDALGLHVICTLNSDLHDLDPALLRPGRLIARREFRRLPPGAIARLAAHLGRAAPEKADLSLAELFNPPSDAVRVPGPRRRALGFGAAAHCD